MSTPAPAPAPAQDATGAAADPAGAARGASRGWRRPAVVVGAGLVAVVVAASTAVYAGWDGRGSSTSAPGAPVAAGRAPAPAPDVLLIGRSPDGSLPWSAPLTVAIANGRLRDVQARAADGTQLTGSVDPVDGRWKAVQHLVPSTAYTIVALADDEDGNPVRTAMSARTVPAEKTLEAVVSPGDGKVVGVGQPVIVRLDRPVKDAADRAEVERRLTVTTVPAVQGAWRWMSSSELHYRGPDFWAPGTQITVSTALDGVELPDGVWGSGGLTSTFTVGDALTAVVDNTAHTMTVSKNGQVLRVMKASMGRPQFPTRNGTFLVLEKFADRVMDSATVDLPPGTPAYRTAVKDAVRITNSGTFTHGAPWSVASQGRANVSHGCINLSPADAHWYFLQAKRGDVVKVVNSTAGPSPSDAGSMDWNMTFDTWRSGSALA